MELKYRGKAKLKQGGKVQEIEVYSNDLSLTENEKRLFGEQIGEIIAKYYQNPEHKKEFEEWKKIKIESPNCSVQSKNKNK